jgi:outer membrane biosynthesis protein TonB
MNKFPALMCSLFVATQGFAQTATVPPSSYPPSAPATETTPPAETKPAPETKSKAPAVRITLPPAKTSAENAAQKKEMAKKTDTKKKEEPKIEGIVVSRGEKGFMGVEIVGGAFKITFYDKKKEKIAPDVARAALRWDAKYKLGQERIVLNPGADGKSLSNPKVIRPPYHFKLFITLVKETAEAEDPASETHVIDFRA